MAPLSHDFSSVILPHNSFGKHLNASRDAIYEKLEKKNFGQTWSNTVIIGHPADCMAVLLNQESNIFIINVA